MTPVAIREKAATWQTQRAQGGLRERHVLIQFGEAITLERKDLLVAKGVQLLQPLGGNAFFAKIDASKIDAADLQQNHGISGLGDVERNWKLAPTLLAGAPPSWSVVSRKSDGQTPDTVAVQVLLHQDVDLVSACPGLINRHSLVIRSQAASINCLVVELPADEINALADEDSVQWIEPPLPPLAAMNDSNRVRTQADLIQAAPYGLDGSGVSILVYDVGTVYAAHPDFAGRAHVRDSTALNDHPTHVSGIIGGDGSLSGGLYRGMAPGVTIQSYGLEYIGGPGEVLYDNVGDIEADYSQAINTHGAMIANNSIGINVACYGYPCDWEGDYEATHILIDSIVRGSLGSPMRVVWATGNERTGASCWPYGHSCSSTGYRTIPPPAGAKNHIAVGAVNSNDDSMTAFSRGSKRGRS